MFSATELKAREAALLGILLKEKLPTAGWVEAWTPSESGRRPLR